MRVPTATYRLQLSSDFGFTQARRIVPYLARLGISDVYASPVFRAKKHSTHGYDVTDHNQLNPELGGSEQFDQLAREVKANQMGWLQDIVPNHMAFDRDNAMLMDVLENGPGSAYYEFFDIAWQCPWPELKDKVLTPFLGEPVSQTIENDKLRVGYDSRGLHVSYYENHYPLNLFSYQQIFEAKEAEDEVLRLIGPTLKEISSICIKSSGGFDSAATRKFKDRLWRVYKDNASARAFMDKCLEEFNGRLCEYLPDLLEKQFYKLAYWKEANRVINYRRFFHLNDFIALRPEDARVFDFTHQLVLEMVQEGRITGIRIDHIDGLYNPADYLKRLKRESGGCYTVVEKILDLDEQLHQGWQIEGTSGYQFMNYLNAVFCCRDNEKAFTDLYHEFTGYRKPHEELLYEQKRKFIEMYMEGQIRYLVFMLKRISAALPGADEINEERLQQALEETAIALDVYRTYINEHHFCDADRKFISDALNLASQRNPQLENETGFLRKVFFLEVSDAVGEKLKSKLYDFIMRFQQVTGPIMAKGFEDTFLYVYNRFVSLNEVGASPDRFGISIDDFHKFNIQRAKLSPAALSATSTHDTKRGEDVRARLNVLSEMPKRWEQKVYAWGEMNRDLKDVVLGSPAPDSNEEYLLYQILVGARPFETGQQGQFVQRIQNYMLKAIRESKVHTTWVEPDEDYERASSDFVRRILDKTRPNKFMDDFLLFQREVAYYGVFNSLSQTLLKITAPGLPDFYQGSELWDLNLVDPDNRRPVDFDRRSRLLDEITAQANKSLDKLAQKLLKSPDNGQVKLFLIYRLLRARNEHSELFQKGEYVPVEVKGQQSDKIISFARVFQEKWVLTVAPRFLSFLVSPDEIPVGEQTWGDTLLVPGPDEPTEWKSAITGRDIRADNGVSVAKALESFPCAMLIGSK